MEQHDFLQGSPEWHQHRATHFNASDAPAMLGISQYKTRNQLLHEMATGIIPEVDAATQRRFDAGHRFEALARQMAEQIIGKKLYPVIGSEGRIFGRLSASFDGLTADDSVAFEHKTLNNGLREALSAGEIPEQYRAQMEQQLMLSGAERCLFMASRWNDADELIEEMHQWYESDPAMRERLLQGWAQFAIDLENYQHVEHIPAAVAAPIKGLPAIVVSVGGSLTVETNFAQWGKELNDFIARIPPKPSTDQEFADCKAAVSALKKAEAQLDAEESRVLSLVPSIDDMKREKKLLRDLSSTTRLALEKMVAARDLTLKTEIIQAGKDELAEHIANLNNRIGKPYMPVISADWADAIKSKKSYLTMRSAVSDLVAAKKIESSAIADRIQINLNTLREHAKDYPFLFADAGQLVLKPNGDCMDTIKLRIMEHKQAEARKEAEIRAKAEADAAAKLEADRARIQAEEEAKAKVTNDALLAAERAKMEAEAKAKAEADQRAKPPVSESERPVAQDQVADRQSNPPDSNVAVIEHQDAIGAFLASRDFGKEAGKVRAILVEFVKWNATWKHKEAA